MDSSVRCGSSWENTRAGFTDTPWKAVPGSLASSRLLPQRRESLAHQIRENLVTYVKCLVFKRESVFPASLRSPCRCDTAAASGTARGHPGPPRAWSSPARRDRRPGGVRAKRLRDYIARGAGRGSAVARRRYPLSNQVLDRGADRPIAYMGLMPPRAPSLVRGVAVERPIQQRAGERSLRIVHAPGSAHDPAPPGAGRSLSVLAFVGWMASSSPPCRMQRAGRAPSATAPGRHTGQAASCHGPTPPDAATSRASSSASAMSSAASSPACSSSSAHSSRRDRFHRTAPRRASRLTTSAGVGFR